MAGRHSNRHHPSLPAIAGLTAAGAALLVVVLIVVTSGGTRHARATLSRPQTARVHVYTAPTATYAPDPAPPPPPTTTTVTAPTPTPVAALQPIPPHVPTSNTPGALTARCRDGSISTT